MGQGRTRGWSRALAGGVVGCLLGVASALLMRRENHALMLSTGVSFPTGGIREKGDTPAPGPKNQLPYTMQLGSGTWDIPIGLSYMGSSDPLPWAGPLSWGVGALGKVRTGRNSRGYRLGDRVLITGWLRAEPLPWIHPTVKVEATIWERITGTDKDFPGPIFPTPVADPRNFGGKRVDLLVGARFKPPDLGEAVHHRQLVFGLPVFPAHPGRAMHVERARLTLRRRQRQRVQRLGELRLQRLQAAVRGLQALHHLVHVGRGGRTLGVCGNAGDEKQEHRKGAA